MHVYVASQLHHSRIYPPVAGNNLGMRAQVPHHERRRAITQHACIASRDINQVTVRTSPGIGCYSTAGPRCTYGKVGYWWDHKIVYTEWYLWTLSINIEHMLMISVFTQTNMTIQLKVFHNILVIFHCSHKLQKWQDTSTVLSADQWKQYLSIYYQHQMTKSNCPCPK